MCIRDRHNRTRCAELKERYGNMIRSIIEAYMAQENLHAR